MERPIILKDHEVRGILDGRQTQLRRIVKELEGYEDKICLGLNLRTLRTEWCGLHVGKKLRNFKCPLGEVGDRLWGRETFYEDKDEYDYLLSSEHPYYKGEGIIYRADLSAESDYYPLGGWVPSSSAPRWSSRILLEIVSVRVERLQDISESNALDSGIWYEQNLGYTHNGEEGSTECPSDAFADRWDHDNGDGNWKANPWVWVIEFNRVTAHE